MDYDITTDDDLYSSVRAETGYKDNTDELPKSKLQTLVNDAKLLLSVRFEETDFYHSRPLTLVLLGTVCIKAKARMENAHIKSWDFGGGSVVAKTSDDDELQVQRYETWINTGVSEMEDTTSHSQPAFGNTHDYVGGT